MTVVIPTIHNVVEELRPSLESILACNPAELILVTTDDKRQGLEDLSTTLRGTASNLSTSASNTDKTSPPPLVRVLSTPIANKRLQVCEALPQVRTAITIMADDDVTWPHTLMPWILAPFEDPSIGGVGTNQRVRRLSQDAPLSSRVWNWLGAAYIERRNFEISATHNMDGGTSCMSGRTGAYRSEILSSHDFLHGFRHEKWRAWILNADDDNFVTRWLVSHQWRTWIQYDDECEVETTLEDSDKFLFQCARWARSNWRSNWTSLVRERHVWTQQPWCTYALHIATFTSLAFVVDPLLVWACWRATQGWEHGARVAAVTAQVVYMMAFTKVVKLVGLFRRDWSDLRYLPVSIVFGYFHGLLKLYALFTLNMVCSPITLLTLFSSLVLTAAAPHPHPIPVTYSIQSTATNFPLRHPGAAEPTETQTTSSAWPRPRSPPLSSRRPPAPAPSSATTSATKSGRRLAGGRHTAMPLFTTSTRCSTPVPKRTASSPATTTRRRRTTRPGCVATYDQTLAALRTTLIDDTIRPMVAN